MNRREILAGAGVLTTALFSGVAFAADKKAVSKDALKKIIDTSFDCLKTGEACQNHCVEMMSHGDTSMKTCLVTVQNMMAACNAMIKVGTLNTAKPDTIRDLAKVCADLCKECGDSCKAQSQHPVCKACAESCGKCIDACNQITA